MDNFDLTQRQLHIPSFFSWILHLLLVWSSLKAPSTIAQNVRIIHSSTHSFETCTDDELVRAPFKKQVERQEMYQPWRDYTFQRKNLSKIAQSGAGSKTNCGMIPNEVKLWSSADTWPWQVVVSSSGYKCAGVLLADEWVLTQAACLDKKKSEAATSVFLVREIVMNDYKFRMKIGVKKRIVLPQVSGKYQMKDFVLLRLSTAVSLNRQVQPVCLPSASQHTNVESSRLTCYTVGIDAYGHMTAKLKASIVDFSKCKLRYASVLWSNHLCVDVDDSSNPKANICPGNNGRPLMCSLGEQKPYFLAGLSVFGPRCPKERKPIVYTKIAIYIDLIQQTIRT